MSEDFTVFTVIHSCVINEQKKKKKELAAFWRPWVSGMLKQEQKTEEERFSTQKAMRVHCLNVAPTVIQVIVESFLRALEVIFF